MSKTVINITHDRISLNDYSPVIGLQYIGMQKEWSRDHIMNVLATTIYFNDFIIILSSVSCFLSSYKSSTSFLILRVFIPIIFLTNKVLAEK